MNVGVDDPKKAWAGAERDRYSTGKGRGAQRAWCHGEVRGSKGKEVALTPKGQICVLERPLPRGQRQPSLLSSPQACPVPGTDSVNVFTQSTGVDGAPRSNG